MNPWKRLKRGVDHVAGKALGIVTAPTKYVGGTAAHFMGSNATFTDFNAGLHKLTHGQVRRDDVERAFHAGERFIAHAPAAVVHNVGKTAQQVAHEAAEAAGGLLKGGLSGLFSGGGLPLLILLAVAAYVLFGTGTGKRILG